MYLKSLSLLNFKNYLEANFEFSPQINCLTGYNGSGKTNVLDAIYYLSFCKSYFNPIDSQNIYHDDNFFVIDGHFDCQGTIEKVYCGVKKGQKKIFKRNGSSYEKLMEHIGRYPAVIISPADSDLVNEGSETRRKFIDGIIAQYDKKYLGSILKYQKILTNRNRLLKYFWENRSFDQDQMDIWNEQMVSCGTLIYNYRKEFLDGFLPIFQEIYQSISGGAEEVNIDYQSQLASGPFEKLLTEAVDKDRNRQYSTVGIHKDDLVFTIGTRTLKKFASQGQQKSMVIALKLAQFEFISSKIDKKPILLLDDIFDKIDNQRLAHLLKLVTDKKFGQIFITDTDEERILSIFKGLDVEIKSYVIDKGVVV